MRVLFTLFLFLSAIETLVLVGFLLCCPVIARARGDKARKYFAIHRL
jgi:hypothetical protein